MKSNSRSFKKVKFQLKDKESRQILTEPTRATSGNATFIVESHEDCTVEKVAKQMKRQLALQE